MKLRLLFLLALGVLACRDKRQPPPPTVDTLVDTAVIEESRSDTLPDSLIDTLLTGNAIPEDLQPDDTLITPQDSAARAKVSAANEIRSLAASPTAALPAGMPIGAYEYPPDDWCSGTLGVDAGSMPANLIGGMLNKAKYCGIRIAAAIPRREYTTNGESKGPFSLSKAKRAVDTYANALRNVSSTARPYLLYVIVLDDMSCDECWGGGISQPTTAELTRYARSKFPSWAAVALRVDPMWMLGISTWGVDVSHTQWHERKGPKNLTGVAKQKAWYEQARLAAPRVGVKRIAYGVNIGNCSGDDSEPCSATELRTYLATAINFDPAQNCAAISWKYDDHHRLSSYRDAWRYLTTLAKSKPYLRCRA